MIYTKKIFIGLTVAVLLSGAFFGLFPKKAHAASLTYEDQYKIWTSAYLLAECVGDGGYTPGDSTTNAQDAINNIFDAGVQLVDGKLYAKIIGSTNNINNGFDCNTIDDIEPTLKALGYQDIYDFYKALKLSLKKGDPKVEKSTIVNKIYDQRNTLGVKTADVRTDAFLYWYWNRVFRGSVAEGGCSGTLSNSASATAKTNIQGKYYFVDKNGTVKDYSFARYDVDTGDNIEGLDPRISNYTGVDNEATTCRLAVAQLTKTRATAYAKSLSTNQEAAAANASGTSNGTTGEDSASSNDLEIQCSLSITNPISYFMCPLVTGFIELINTLDNAITDQLSVDTDKYFQQQEEAFKKVWTNMRNLALSFIVIVALLMVIGTAIEVGPFDSYTVKKVMPRLLIAVIVISLSWPLVIFLINASNALGYTIRGLIQAPFQEFLSQPVQVGGGQQWLAAAGFAIAGLTLGIVGLFSFVLTALLGVTIAFFTVILRQILVILLAILAPVAIAMYILPNTQKAGKMWWDLFARALLVFPIIAAFIAAGRVFAAISVSNPGNGPGTVQGIIAFVAYFGPYFALPFAFRLAGGAIGQIGGFVNDRGRGGFDRLKKFRQGQTQKNTQKIMGGNRYRETGFANRFNTPLQGAAIVATGGAGINPKRMRSRVATAQAQQALGQSQELLEKNDAFRAIANDGTLLDAVLLEGDRAAITKFLSDSGRYSDDKLNGLVNMVEQARNSGSRTATKVAAVAAKAKNGTDYDTHADMYKDILAASDDVMVQNALLASARSASGQAQRYDLSSPGHTDQFNEMQKLKDGTKSAADVNHEMRTKAFATSGVGTMIGMKEAPFADMTTQIAADYADALAKGQTLKATEIASQMASLRGAMGSASPANRQHIAAMLEASGVQLDAPESVDQQLGLSIARTAGLDDKRVSEEIRSRAGLYDQPAGRPAVSIPEMGAIGSPGPTPPGGVTGP